ncbi:aspartyl-phosphate phosphatase Spo0E family protein [Piscibacillus salipiscarius]|uniref:aspartyl-phosphate phosphatase Spo0E family protein n=1 Tax=Piscibacillus salipiscarius TaxID=299480 RepID=UPI0024368F53|nr:aspartyl-phosphate phosphatase Spo0E family protein [Piscibacillus salipiscarius]
MSSYNQLQQLQQDIEKLRNHMINIASEYGYTSHESIKVSQQLDTLLNEYQFLKNHEKR